ncbi:MAG: diaminopimelate decarboxylase [Deltaproteobacteria bacterium]|jgi:diaminopimelate decarboxylase|nr:diaminopimelate decarboxylase [Deltaproteobacteria bacterium]
MSFSNIYYKDSDLYVEECSLAEIAKDMGTPLYVYSAQTIRANFRAYSQALQNQPHLVAYSVKAASNLSILNLIREEGGGADIVSGGELSRAQAAGISPQKIVFSGVGKTTQEMAQALKAGILMFNVESVPELTVLATVAGDLGLVAKVAFRVNPDIDPKTHPYIATGFKETKFGIPISEAFDLYQKAAADPRLSVIGLDCHIGSQLTSVEPMKATAERLNLLLDKLSAGGITLKYLDIGGGLGINYHGETPPSPVEWVATMASLLAKRKELTLVLEPGRSIVGPAGLLLTRVLYDKVTPYKRFFIVDGAMNDLIRPSLYDSYHEILPVLDRQRPLSLVSVVGPVCESGDFLAKDRQMPLAEPGELLATLGAGAYGFSMSSNYNSRPRPAEVLVDGKSFKTIRTRETLADLLKGETL